MHGRMELQSAGRECGGRCDDYGKPKMPERPGSKYLKFSDPTVKMGLFLPPSQN